MDTVIRTDNRPWEDWEDDGGFDDDDALMWIITPKRQLPVQERPWYYEKRGKRADRPLTFSVQLSFL